MNIDFFNHDTRFTYKKHSENWGKTEPLNVYETNSQTKTTERNDVNVNQNF